MKELSIEEKAKAYDEAFGRAKEVYQRGYYISGDIESIFPELKESEDERIRKELLDYLKCFIPHHDIDLVRKSKVWIAWLEKKELKKIGQDSAWSEEDEKFFETALWHISYSISNGKSTDIRCDTAEWLKSLKDRIQLQPK